MFCNLDLINKPICCKRDVYRHLKPKCPLNCSFRTDPVDFYVTAIDLLLHVDLLVAVRNIVM